MTPTTEGKQLAVDLANAAREEMGHEPVWKAADFNIFMGSIERAFIRLATEHLALKAEHEKALADLREIAVLLENAPDIPSVIADAKAIAAKWRVETDPLVAVIDAIEGQWLRGEITSREALEATAKRGYEIGEKS